MARSSSDFVRGFGSRGSRKVDSWDELVAEGKRRLCEGLGFALVVVCFLLVLSLLTYNPADPSLDTAVDGTPANFLGRDGAFVADLLVQGLGLAAFILPLVVLGWAFRLLLQRPLRHMPRRILMVLPALLFGAFACSVWHTTAIPLPAGAGGALGWALRQVLSATGFGALEWPLAIGAAVVAVMLLLSIMGLSWGDWRDVGNGAGR
ncbi:MAG TPA: DNA translocase FtsK 4TM domain-containing protein, partial [Stellaceae bacterium]|nr:DNA translocase FtsK 4TM domain-containing protein [Stellaceae bacterium]